MTQRISRHIVKLLSLFIVMGMVLSCIEKDEFDKYNNASNELSFSAQVKDNWNALKTSRSTGNTRYYSQQLDSCGLWLHAIVEQMPDSVCTDVDTRASEKTAIVIGEKMGVYAFVTKGTATNEFMINQEVTNTATGWEYSPIKYWPGVGYTVDFYAYLPYAEEGSGIVAGHSDNTPQITYTVPTTVTDQLDLLTATVPNASYSTGTVNFGFKHILTAIRFKCKETIQNGTITRVALNGVYSTGTYNLKDGAWETTASTVNYEQDVDVKITDTNKSDNPAITNESEIFMMIPQTLPDDATLEIDFMYAAPDDSYTSGVKRTLSVPVKEITAEWTTGATITYLISNSPLEWEYTLNMEYDEVDYLGGTTSIDITSLRTSEDGGNETVSWTAQFENEDGQWVDVDNFSSDWVEITSDGDNFSAVVKPQPFVSSDSNVDKLKQANPMTDYDLSQEGETANCYIVNAPGTYKLPLVYGNARSATGSANTVAYAPDNGAPAFKDYQDQDITSPYIAVPEGGDATLVWQDAPNVIEDVQLDDEREFLHFSVNQEYIRPCNAIVAVRDANDVIMWSWHIWISPYALGEGDGTYIRGDNSYTFMPVNLGWCDPLIASSYGQDRSISIKLTQEDGYERIVTFTQKGKDCSFARGNCPYYQWGRKDPTPAADGNYVLEGGGDYNTAYYKEKEIFGPYPFSLTAEISSQSLGYSIQYPYLFIRNKTSDRFATSTNYNSWCNEDDSRSNYWNATGKSGENVKSVYDPCPVGYKVPILGALSAVTTGLGREIVGNSTSVDISELPVIKKDDDTYEDYFIFNGESFNNITPPAEMYQRWYLTGQRYENGQIKEAAENWGYGRGGHQGFYQSSEPTASEGYKASFFYLSKKYPSYKITTDVHEQRVWGKCIRPVKDCYKETFNYIYNGGEY